jgi:hypothetical protein
VVSLVWDGELLAGRVQRRHRPIEGVHLEVERVGEARVDRSPVERVVGHAEQGGGAQIAVACAGAMAFRGCYPALVDPATGETGEGVEEGAVVARLHCARQRLDLAHVTAAVRREPDDDIREICMQRIAEQRHRRSIKQSVHALLVTNYRAASCWCSTAITV